MRNSIFEKIAYGLAAAVFLLFLCSRCANTQAGPSGGPKDTIPPVLLKTTPKTNATYFAGKKIELAFDEYIALKEISKNVVMSPPSLRKPLVQRRGRNIQVVFQDTLWQNKTYTIDFGNALADNNEGNLYPPYKFVFSTGGVIDSMAFTGVVRDAYTLDPVENTAVMLYENLSDSAVYKELPIAIARTDSWGYFSLQNIAPQAYHMYALEDKNSNYRYDPGNEKIAFLDTLVIPEHTVSMLPVITDNKDTAALEARPVERLLLISAENVRKQFLVEYPQLEKRKFQLVFNQHYPVITCFQIEGVNEPDYVIESSRFRDTLTYWLTGATVPDTLRATIEYLKTDSLNNLSPTSANLRFSLKKEDKAQQEKDKKNKNDTVTEIPKLQPKINFSEQLGMRRGISVAFPALPAKIDTTKITLFKIDEKKNRAKELFRWLPDTASRLRFYVQAKWVTVTEYELEVLPDAFSDIYGLVNDTIVNKFTTPNPDKFCHITFDLSNVSSRYILQLLNEKKDRILRETLVDKAGKVLFDYLPSGDYVVRFIEDANQNGVWDACKMETKTQPEKVTLMRFPDASEILHLRENSEVEQSVDVGKLFTPFQATQDETITLDGNTGDEK
ncbi:MAG: Ig-like domain-containing protein [Prevotellaceae bacterium]|jgi:hypothetical protein|nr:Ig-like domain-containing protein [Prevotellaceae bacterium]